MRRLILTDASVSAVAIGGAGVSVAADGHSTPNLGADTPAASGNSQSGTNAGATVPAPYGVTANQQGGVNLPSSEIKRAQEQLRNQGLYRGSIDGRLGAGDQAGTPAIPRKNGLQMTATLD